MAATSKYRGATNCREELRLFVVTKVIDCEPTAAEPTASIYRQNVYVTGYLQTLYDTARAILTWKSDALARVFKAGWHTVRNWADSIPASYQVRRPKRAPLVRRWIEGSLDRWDSPI